MAPPVVTVIELLNEVAFFIFIYQFFFRMFLTWLVGEWVIEQPWFVHASKRKGLFAANGQDDVILNIVTAAHHISFGLLMLLGALFGSDRMFKWGTFGELAFELLDLAYNLLGMFPYDEGRVKMEIRLASAFHHVPGVLLSVPMVYNNVHANIHLKLLGGWLLFAGGVSIAVACYIYTRDFHNKEQMQEATIAQLFGAVFFFYARWYVFPREVVALARDISESTIPISPLLVYFGAFFLFLFNSIVAVAVIKKSIAYIGKAFGADVNLEDADTKPKLVIPEKGLKVE